MRVAGYVVGLTVALLGRAMDASPTIRVIELSSPAAAQTMGPAFTTAPDGTAWLSWIEAGQAVAPAVGKAQPSIANTLRFATFDSKAGAWSAARPIVSDATVAPNALDGPQLALDGQGAAYAVWTDGHGGARWAKSLDGGTTWSTAEAWSKNGAEVEKFSLARLAHGELLAAWLDGRGRISGGKAQQLYTRVVDDPRHAPDELVDPSVCDCCPTALAAFLDGGALVAYRGRTDEEVRDVHLARLRNGKWGGPRVPAPDDWRINSCPVNGPRLAIDGSRVAAAWFTGADNDPRVLVTFSPDAGNRWLMPLRVDQGKPVGHVDLVILRDGAVVVTWLESDGSIWLHRITPDFSATRPILLAGAGDAALSGAPRLLLLHDYAGARSSAEILAVYTRAKGRGLRTLRVSVPEGDLVNAERNCACAPTLAELEGFPVRGVVLAVDPVTNTVNVRHAEVPGVMAAGSDSFRVDPLVLAALQPAHDFLGRVARHNDTWWLSDIRRLER